MRFLVLAVLFCVPALAVDDSYTAGYTNGRGWAVMLPLAKAAWLQGFNQGSEYVKTGAALMPASLSFGEISAAVDMFYRDPTNAPVPVVWAISYVKRKVEGASEAELKTIETGFRKGTAALLEALKGK